MSQPSKPPPKTFVSLGVKKNPQPLKSFFRLLAIVLAGMLFLFIVTGFLTTHLIRHVSPQVEKNLGKILKPRIKKELNVKGQAKAEVQAWVAEMGKMMSYEVDNVYLHFEFEVVCSDIENAFALPGGSIVILSGLLKKLQTDSELALLLGHEMGHIINRDPAKQMGRNFLLAILWFSIAGTTDNPDLPILIGLSGSLLEKSFSRSQEKAADLLGLDLIRKSGYDIQSAPNLYKILESKFQIPDFISSHPSSKDRYDLLLKEIQEKQWLMDDQVKSRQARPLPEIMKDPCLPEKDS